MTIFERLQVFLKYKGLTFNKVAQLIVGVSASLLSKGLKNPDASLGSEKITKILEYFPDLSAEWLLRGEGNMLRGVEEKSKGNTSSNDKLVESYQNQIKHLESEIMWLRGLIQSNTKGSY